MSVLLTAAVILAMAVLALAGSLAAPQRAQAAVGKGLVDWRLEAPEPISDLSTVPAMVSEMGAANLGADWTRVYFRWARLQPTTPGVVNAALNADGYDTAYVAELDTVIAAFHAQGVRVILTGTDVPAWAINKKFQKGAQYTRDVVPNMGNKVVRTAWQKLATYLASRYADRAGQSFAEADHFEVWNEPNLSSGLYPQLVGAKKTPVGPSTYLKMLKYFSIGAKKGNHAAVIIAGGTSRRGSNDKRSTSPQWFASYLKRMHATRYFSAYSHHPYAVPGSKPSPSALPPQRKRMVTLGNIGRLLKIFPNMPFYLTEFGYSTGGSHDLFCIAVSPANQAKYLRQAYALVARHKQIKALFWFVETDCSIPTPGDPASGIFSGLATSSGVHKPAWGAFAGLP